MTYVRTLAQFDLAPSFPPVSGDRLINDRMWASLQLALPPPMIFALVAVCRSASLCAEARSGAPRYR